MERAVCVTRGPASPSQPSRTAGWGAGVATARLRSLTGRGLLLLPTSVPMRCHSLRLAEPCPALLRNLLEPDRRNGQNLQELSRAFQKGLELAGTSLGQPRPLLPDTSAACAAGSLPHAPNATTYCSYVIFNLKKKKSILGFFSSNSGWT